MDKLYLIGFAQSLFFVVLILTKKKKVLSDYFLSFFIFLLGGHSFFTYCISSGLFHAKSSIIFIDIYYWTLLGPTLLMYTNLMTKESQRLELKFLFYLIPMIIATIGFSKYIFVNESNFYTEMNNKNWHYILFVYIWMYNSPLFYVFTIMHLRNHQKKIKQFYSYSKNVDLKWLYFLSNGFAVFLFFTLFETYLEKFLGIKTPSIYSYTWLIMVIYIFGIGFYGYRQRGIFLHIEDETVSLSINPENSESDNPETNKIVKGRTSYQKSGLKKEEADELAQNLLDIMINEKLYIDSELNLLTLAQRLGTSSHKLSQVINENFAKNFFDFINEFRIEEVKKQLFAPEKSNYKIMAIAKDCGFNSKSSFYTIFKNSTSLTPSEYINHVKEQQN
ncbi:helix-turn-helix domain-containing protein [candidate division KSB1 bacterium]